MRTRHLNHSTFELQYHVVWGAKYRYQWLKDYVRTDLRRSFQDTCKKYPELHIFETNTDQDHVHLQMEIAPNTTIADAVSFLKSHSSFALKKKYKFIRDMYAGKDGIWSVGYFVSSIGLNEATVKHYIEWQGRKEKPQTTTLF